VQNVFNGAIATDKWLGDTSTGGTEVY